MPNRIQRKRTKGWRMPENAFYAGRPTLFGNPWTGPDAVEAYRRFMRQVRDGVLCLSSIEGGLTVTREFQKPIDNWKKLRGLIVPRWKLHFDLACWCGLDSACHVDILLSVARGEFPLNV